MRDEKKACRNLYRFIRMRLGNEMSDREIARLWEMDWKSFGLLKSGKRQIPRVNELMTLSSLIGVDPAVVFEVARGVSATKIHKLLLAKDWAELSRLLMTGIYETHTEVESRSRQFRAVLDRVNDAVFTVDPQGRFQDVNQRLCQLTGYTVEELLHRSLFDLLPPSQTPLVMEAFASVYTTGETRGVELTALANDGSALALELNASRIEDDYGNGIGVQGIARDITARRQAEDLSRKLADFVQDSVDAIFTVDLDGTVLHCNHSAERMFACERGEMIGQQVSRFVPSESLREKKDDFEQLSQGKSQLRVTPFEREALTKDGRRIHVSVSLTPVRDTSGKVTAVTSILRDITLRKELEQALKENEERYSALFDRSLDGVYLHDFEGNFIDANPSALRLLGYTHDEIPTLSFASLLSEDQLSLGMRTLAELREKGYQAKPTEFILRAKSGDMVHVETTASVILRQDRPWAILGIARDISARAEEHHRLRAMFDAMPALCMLIDKEGTVLRASRLLFEICGRPPQEVIGRPVAEVFSSQKDFDKIPSKRAFSTGALEQNVVELTDRKGKKKYIHMVAQPVIGDGGEVKEVVHLSLDVTEQLRQGDPRLLALWQGPSAKAAAVRVDDAEKRRFVRAQMEANVRWASDDKQGVAMMQNIGRSGMFFETEELLPAGTMLKLDWDLPDDSMTVQATAIVVWTTHQTARSPSGLGVQFKDVTPRHQEAIVDSVLRKMKGAEGNPVTTS